MKKSVLVASLLGGVGGAVNALLCYAGVPERLDSYSEYFKIHLIPAGAAHGFLLVFIPLSLAKIFKSKWLVVPGFLIVGFLSGWASFIGLHLSLFDATKPVLEAMKESLLWPFDSWGKGQVREQIFELFKETLKSFGMVSAVYFLGLTQLSTKRAGVLTAVAIAVAAGVLGSAWWWIEYKPWYYCLIHGSIWGVLTGFGVWVTQGTKKGNAR